jgi:hypothetical protein
VVLFLAFPWQECGNVCCEIDKTVKNQMVEIVLSLAHVGVKNRRIIVPASS